MPGENMPSIYSVFLKPIKAYIKNGDKAIGGRLPFLSLIN